MSDIKFDIMRKPAVEADLAKKDSELEKAMQPYIDSGQHSEEQLAEIKKNISNRLKNEKELRKQEEEERKKLATPKKEEEKSTKKVVLGEGDNANDMLVNADAEKKGGDDITNQQFDDSNIDHNKLYTNNNPLYNSFRHDVTLEGGSNFWDMEEEDAIEMLREKYGHTDIKFEETNITTQRRGKAQPKGQTVSRKSFDAIKMIAPDGSEETIELDLQGFFQEDFGGWEATKIDNYNKLTNFLEAHTAESDKAQTITNDKERAIYLEKVRVEKLEPTEEEYIAQIEEKELTSTDIFNEKKGTKQMGGTVVEVNLEFGGHEEEIEQARKQLIQENRGKAVASNTPYVEPTIDEIKDKALLNLQNAERKYLRTSKYDAYMNELEDFEDWDADWILKRAEEKGAEKIGTSFSGKPIWDIKFKEKIRKEMKDQYYKLKVAGNDEEANAVLKYRANELLLKNSVSKIETSDVYKRFNETNAMIQNPSAVFAPHENEVELENGKIVPLHIWEQHIKDQVEVQGMMSDFDGIMKQADESISVLEDGSFKWDMIKRNYNDWERTQEVLGYGFANIGATAIYGVPKLLTFGASGGDDEVVRWKETVAKNRQSFRKDVEWDRAFEDGNFGRFMAQSAIDQIPIYATLMTGHAGLGILGSSVFGDKWAEMTMEDRYRDGAPSPTWEKWFKSLGYGASEIVLDYAITVPIMRNARNMMRGGKGKAMLDNSMPAFFRENASKALVFSPALESVSEGATQVTQNMIDGRPITENLDHAAFLGLTMGMGISYTGFTGGLITSQFSDQKSMQEVRDNLTEVQKLYNINADIKEGLKYLGPRSADAAKGKETIKNNEARIEELMNQNETVINKVNDNIKDKISPKAYREFIANESRSEQIKVEAQKILDSGLDKKTQNKRLKELLVYFDASNSAAQHFKDPKAFGSRWTFVTNATSKEGKENLERLKDLARTELQNEGKQEPDDKKVLERARYVWAKEQVRESNKSYQRTDLAKNYKSFETIDEAADAIDRQIQGEINVLNANNKDGTFDNHIKRLEETKKELIAAIKSGDTYGLTHVDIFGESTALSVVETQAKAERFETRTHEGGHQVFWNALQSEGADVNFTAMAEQVLDWLKKNDAAMLKRVVSLTEKDIDGNLISSEVISVFLEEVGSGKFDVKKNRGFTNLWGLMSNDVITKTTGKDFEFDFAGETDVMNFLIGLGKKIKNGTLTKADERAIRKSELLRSFQTKEGVESITNQFSKEASDNVQRIYEQQGEAGAFDIMEEFKPITTRIARRYREVPGYNEELLVSEIEIGKRGVLDLIQEYKLESGVPLAAYINTYLPARAIEAANRILEEQFTEDVTERVDIATEEVAEVDVKAKSKKKKIILSDRLGVKSKVDKAIKAKLPKLDIENLNFKTLKDQTPEITGEMFGISPKKLISGANITKKELQSAQMFINKNAGVLMAMLPEGATAGGTATGVPQTLLKAFYTKTDRAKMAKTGTKAGLAVQVKNNINKTDFLETFGIINGKPDRTDRNTSARVLALANQTGKMMTNQAVRQEVEKQGNVSQGIVLKLQDGKSSVMFSKAIPESKHDIYYAEYGDLVAEISNSNNKDLESIKNRVTNVFKDDFTKSEIIKVSKEIFNNVKAYGVLEKKHIMPSGRKVMMPQTLQEFLIDKAIGDNLDYGVKEILKKYLPKDKNGKTIDIGTHYLDKNRINRQRAAIVDLGIEMSKTMPVEEVLETILKYYKGMFVGASKIADGRFIEKNGVVINNPNYKPLVPKKGKDGVVKMVPPKNRKQVFQNMQDFIDNFVMKLPGVTNVSTKISKDKKVTIDKVTINGEPVSIDSKLLGENSKAALRDMDFKGREAQALKARKEVERLLDFYFKKMSEKNPSLDAADLGMILTSMGSGMTSIMRRSANFKYMGIGVENSKNPGKDLEYEHMIPQVEMALKILKSYLENGTIDNSIWEGYHVAIIPKTMDDVLVENKFRSKSPVSGNRYYNMVNFGDKRLVPIKSIDPADNGKIIGEDFVKAGNIINGTIKEIQDMGVVSRAYMFSRAVNPAKGITVLDFDDTLATTKSGVRAKIPNSDGLPKPQRKVIFLAGGAGSGKSNVVSKLGLEDQGFKVVNSDISLEWLKKNNGLPENMNELTKEQRSKLGSLQHQARGIAKRKMMKYQGNADGVVVDGTGGSIKSMEKLVNEFKDKGYDVSMLFVETSLDVALERNAARKERSLLDKIVTKNHESVQGNKDGFKAMFGDRFMEVNTDNLSQQDAMPSKLTDKMNDFVSGYENRRLDAEEFASEGADILDQGGTFDFSEFNKVVEGQTAPLFNKAMKLQDKFGNKDMFVLTARPAESADAIHAFLTANGLDIPLENITGLANSTPESKALWIADKVAEGYNDFYFADDALQNVQAVQNMLDQFDVKSKIQQAKVQFSRDASQTFNNILEVSTGIKSIKEFSDAQARLRGKKTKYKSIIPASAQDFQGLLYNFLGRGKKGEADMAFFKKALIDPFARGINELNSSRQSAANDFENLNKKFPDVKKKLNKNIKGLDYTNDQAMRVYLWNKAGFEVPGLSKRDLAVLTSFVESNPEMKAYADAIGLISKKEDGYSQPKDYWLAENIASDLLSDGAIGDKRSDFLAEWKQNKDIIFSPKNLNKIEAIYGSKFREALEDMLYRMETGRNRPTGNSRLVNGYMNWVNNSVGAIMFLNMRSATLQTISAANYMNWTDNNPLKAGMAFANQKQFWKDFVMIYNSDYLKQRRSGNQRGINEAELSAAVAGSDNKAKAAIAWLLKKGFTPTQIADSFAISMGGASMLRNRIKTYIKEGMSQKDAEAKAWLDFQETTEVNQQSARPDMISQQQASPLGRLILAFQNTPMQYARIMNKATRDLVNGRGDYKAHISKIAYYGVVQSIIFGALQSALYASLGDDDEEDFDKKKERILNQMVDSWLTGIGVGGKAIGTVKNTLMEYFEQRDKGFNSDHAYTLLSLLSFSPPIGSKLRKIYSSIQTEEFNRGVFTKRGFTLDNPIWSGVGNVIEGVTNLPFGRTSNLMLQLDNAMDANHKWWQRVALLLGQNTWDLGIKDPDIEAIKADVKKDKKKKKKTTKDINKEAVNKKKQVQERKEGKTVMCAAVSKSGNRCKTKVEPGSSYCTIHIKVKQNKDGKQNQCKKIKKGGKRCKMQTSASSGYCYYHD